MGLAARPGGGIGGRSRAGDGVVHGRILPPAPAFRVTRIQPAARLRPIVAGTGARERIRWA
ncbi:hypothetical protein SSKA14_1986 [Stenotrophomonas sp. SKA14]|nr:hypothetical protein SSKA14_1986 [Stenotrophomonas sp. SKA14]